jgi:hypothetical protein
MDEFRGITVSPVISKLFEHCLLRKFSKYLGSSDAQLGFKQSIGCNHAIFSIKQIIDYYANNGSTVNLCTLDISKAFDKVNYYILFIKLLDRNVPKHLVNILISWYFNSFVRVRWMSELSSSFKLNAGVRQGGVLSPVLFALYVNDLLFNLHKSKLGCIIRGLTVNSFMYADDLILLSASVIDLQHMIDLCSNALNSLDLSFNAKKMYVF